MSMTIDARELEISMIGKNVWVLCGDINIPFNSTNVIAGIKKVNRMQKGVFFDVDIDDENVFILRGFVDVFKKDGGKDE